MRRIVLPLLLAAMGLAPAFAAPPRAAAGLSRAEALRVVANLGRILESEGRTLTAGTIAPTHSMEPLLDSDCLILVAPVAFDDIRVNDLIAFRDPRFRVHAGRICHRVAQIRSDGLITRGDALPDDDAWIVRPGDVIGRVFAVIHLTDRRGPGASTAQIRHTLAEMLDAYRRAARGLTCPRGLTSRAAAR